LASSVAPPRSGWVWLNGSWWSRSQRQAGCRQEGKRQVLARVPVMSRMACRGR